VAKAQWGWCTDLLIIALSNVSENEISNIFKSKIYSYYKKDQNIFTFSTFNQYGLCSSKRAKG